MQTVFDWLSMAIFAGLVVLFLQRSVAPEPRDRMVSYVPPAVGCAVGNQFGNHGYSLVAIFILFAALAYSWFVLRPFSDS